MEENCNVARNGRLYVMDEKCKTCIFRPGNLMHLQRGRVRGMIDAVKADDGCIPCHNTLGGDNAVCRGQFDLHPTTPMQIAERLGMIEWQKEERDV